MGKRVLGNGILTNDNKEPLVQAFISLLGSDEVIAVTDEQGAFQCEVEQECNNVLQITHNDAPTGYKSIQKGNFDIKIEMSIAQVQDVLGCTTDQVHEFPLNPPSASGNTSLPIGRIIMQIIQLYITLQNGIIQEHEGPYRLLISQIDASNPEQLKLFPGNFNAIMKNTNRCILESYNMIYLGFQDRSGNSLTLSNESQIKLKIPTSKRFIRDAYLFHYDGNVWNEIDKQRAIKGQIYHATLNRGLKGWFMVARPIPSALIQGQIDKSIMRDGTQSYEIHFQALGMNQLVIANADPKGHFEAEVSNIPEIYYQASISNKSENIQVQSLGPFSVQSLKQDYHNQGIVLDESQPLQKRVEQIIKQQKIEEEKVEKTTPEQEKELYLELYKEELKEEEVKEIKEVGNRVEEFDKNSKEKQYIKFEGLKVLIGQFYNSKTLTIQAQSLFERRGILCTVVEKESSFIEALNSDIYHQIWIISNYIFGESQGFSIDELVDGMTDEEIELNQKKQELHLKEKFVNAVEKQFNDGVGLMLWAENHPFFAHANIILERLSIGKDSKNKEIKIELKGELKGEGTLTPGDGRVSGQFTYGYPIMIGVNEMPEGNTICYPEITSDSEKHNFGDLDIGATGTDGYPCIMRYLDKIGRKFIIDTGFTKLEQVEWLESIGVQRYVENCLISLMFNHKVLEERRN